MSECILTMEDLEKNFLDWVKIDSDVVNVSKVLNDLLDLVNPKDVTWVARDSNDNLITVTVPNIAKIIENIKVDAVSRSELTSILTNYYTKLDIDNDIKEGLINFIKQNYYDKTYIDQLYTTVRQVIDGLSEDTKDASRLSKGTLDPDRLPEVIHSNTTGDADTVDGLHGDQLVRADEDDYLYGSYTIAHDLTVLGNLNVKGAQTSQNTNELNVSNTWITLNEGETSDHVTNITSGIRIDRGTSDPARIYWDDDVDKWLVDYGDNTGYEIFSKGYMGSGSGLDADKLDGIDSTQFVRNDVDNVINGVISFLKYLKTDKIDNTTGSQIVINAGNSDGKVTNQTDKAIYVNAEEGLIISTPDRAHSNWDSGYVVKVTEILGDSIKTENINLSNQLTVNDANQSVVINKDKVNISQKDTNNDRYMYETLIDANNKSIVSNWYKNGDILTSKALVLNSDGTVNINNHLTIDNSGITIKRTNAPDQYLTITEDVDVAAVPAIVSYSATDNAKFIIYDSKTNANNDAPTSGVLGHYFRINGNDTLIIRDDEFTYKNNTIWHSGNDGSGSGLDADKLDGLESTQFVRSDVSNFEVTGTIEMKADNQFKLSFYNTANHPSSEIHFNSYTNYGSDYAYIRYDDDNNNYNRWGDSSENSALVIGVQNDGQNSDSDVIALESPAGIFLNAPQAFLGNKDGHLILADMGTSLGSSGYMKLNNGLIIQWAYVSTTIDGNNTVKINLPITFPNAAVHATGVIVSSSSYDGVFNLYLQTLNTSYVEFHSDNSASVSANVTVRCFVIGY